MDNLAAAPAPVENVDRTVPAGISVPAKKGGKGAVVLAILFALIAVGLGVWLAILLLNPAKGGESKNENNTNNGGSSNQANNGGSSSADNSIRNDAKIREIMKKAGEAWGTAAEYAVISYGFDGVFALPVSSSVQTDANHSYYFATDSFNSSLSLGSAKARVVKNLDSAEKSLASAISGYGLKKVDEPKNYENFNFSTVTKSSYYESDEIFCVSVWDDNSYTFSCADKSWVSEAKKNLAIALAAAYNKKNSDNQLGYIYGSPDEIKNNSDGTYELITAGVNDAVALFYRKKGTEDWTFFTFAQSGISCDRYNTAELKEAYKGEKCWVGDTDKESTVK